VKQPGIPMEYVIEAERAESHGWERQFCLLVCSAGICGDLSLC
jgi:hypothetical protein